MQVPHARSMPSASRSSYIIFVMFFYFVLLFICRCHTLALFMPERFSLFTHMGCEGANWIGMHRFVEAEHVLA